MRQTRFFTVLLLTAIATIPLMGQSLLTNALATGNSSTDYAATDYIQFNGSSYPSANLICVTAGCGGEFQAAINSGSSLVSASQIPVTVWCADYQLNVTTISQYATDVSMLGNIAVPTDPFVQYGMLPNGSATWNDPLTTASLSAIGITGPILSTVDGGGISTSAYRFTLAAALVSQYVSTPGNVAGGSPVNLAIQEAIWYLTSNDTAGTDGAFDFSSVTDNVNSNTSYAYWVKEVLTNENNVVGNLNLNQWAVVSGPADSEGVSPSCCGGYTDGYNSYQTFIAEVDVPSGTTGNSPLAPEPTFYGVLMIGLGGLFAVVRRRRGKLA